MKKLVRSKTIKEKYALTESEMKFRRETRISNKKFIKESQVAAQILREKKSAGTNLI